MHRLATVHARDAPTNDVTTQPISISASFRPKKIVVSGNPTDPSFYPDHKNFMDLFVLNFFRIQFQPDHCPVEIESEKIVPAAYHHIQIILRILPITKLVKVKCN